MCSVSSTTIPCDLTRLFVNDTSEPLLLQWAVTTRPFMTKLITIFPEWAGGFKFQVHRLYLCVIHANSDLRFLSLLPNKSI